MMKKTNGSSEVSGAMNTIIGKDTVFTGTLDVKGQVRVDGTVKGKIICSDCVTVGSSGTVEADIEADSAVIAGKMHGNITTSGKIELQAKCEMEGDMRTNSLVIEQGAVFCGACDMKDKGVKSDLGFLPPERKDEKDQSKDRNKLVSIDKDGGK
ncbi:polymer-forming cytoskeletal protein [candidate division GN15 bacterium]|nr:polymer-forming cytoskeletal protein [candidate division GN15 bacterium]